MHRHGPDPLPGPLRGTPAWWHGRKDDDPPTPNTMPTSSPTPEPAKRTRKPRKIRTELVERVRREIAAGTYETPEKFQAALDRLLGRMAGTD